MRIALIGYGRMGKEIHQIALDRGHSVKYIIDQNNKNEINHLDSKEIDIAIEFSLPSEAKNNITSCLKNKIPVVSGTTGWTDYISEVKDLSDALKVGFLYASNFSLGMNIFFELNKFLGTIMNKAEAYDVQISEIHHTKKIDKPSGTAITLADQILESVKRKEQWSLDKDTANTLNINSIREGDVPGTHHVNYASEYDDISISHIAKSRKGFALGAVLSAEFLCGKKGVFSMKDVLDSILNT